MPTELGDQLGRSGRRRLNFGGTLDRERDPGRRAVRPDLPPLDPVLAEEDAVVGDEDDDRVVLGARGLERVHHPADTAVDLAQGRQRAEPALLDLGGVVRADRGSR